MSQNKDDSLWKNEIFLLWVLLLVVLLHVLPLSLLHRLLQLQQKELPLYLILGIWLLAQLAAAKVVATALCKGSGLVGGLHAPSLMIGAAMGAVFGGSAVELINSAMPGNASVAQPQAYALVGMAATLASVCSVPLTSVLLLFELTKDYRILLPLMVNTCLVSSICTRGISYRGRERGLLTCYPDTDLAIAKKLMEARGIKQLPVVKRGGEFQRERKHRIVAILYYDSIWNCLREEINHLQSVYQQRKDDNLQEMEVGRRKRTTWESRMKSDEVKGGIKIINSDKILRPKPKVGINEIAENMMAFNTNYKDTGLFGVYAIAKPDCLDDLAYAIMYEMSKLCYRVSEANVTRACNQLKSSLLLHIDGTCPVAEDIGRQDVAIAAMGPIQGLPYYNWFRRRTYWLRY
ncbi:hypothetical protein LOK49_LG06G00201 [Camellia lanceoleosa]|uniref:Uncharacterized protein n=2 Tax=Camellia lanceoleosa TaxID=1840588 RepID=A0ACC0HAJ6_9ERIC|nr:hypothetical protein LOK49_LG06G00201 [Camellia lanceoleosa]